MQATSERGHCLGTVVVSQLVTLTTVEVQAGTALDHLEVIRSNMVQGIVEKPQSQCHDMVVDVICGGDTGWYGGVSLLNMLMPI